MSKIMIVVGHPHTRTFCERSAMPMKKGASARPRREAVPPSEMDFDAILHDGFRKEQPLEPDLRLAYESLASCDHLVLIFPLWCGDMPAMLKGFIERILQPDLIARENTENAMNWHIFANKTARIVMTMEHASLDLSLVVWRIRPQATDAEHPAFHRHQAGAAHALRHDRDFEAGHARAMVARDRGIGKSSKLKSHPRRLPGPGSGQIRRPFKMLGLIHINRRILSWPKLSYGQPNPP